MNFPLYLLLCTVFLLNAAVFADLALYLAVGPCASVALSCFLTTLVLQARLAPIPRLPILAVLSCSRSLSLSSSSVVGSRSATSYLATALRLSTALLSARSGASVCSGPCCESSSGPSVLLMARMESRQFLHDLDLFLKLFGHHIDKKFAGCPHFTCDVSLVELEMQIPRLFSL